MSKGDVFENEMLAHVFLNDAIVEIGDVAGLQPSAAAGSLYVSLHTADPAEGGSPGTNETAYTGYARQAVARDGTGWVITGNSCSPAANIDFPECTASPGGAITHFAVSTELNGGHILYYGTVTPNITMAVGVIPRIKTTSTITED